MGSVIDLEEDPRVCKTERGAAYEGHGLDASDAVLVARPIGLSTTASLLAEAVFRRALETTRRIDGSSASASIAPTAPFGVR